MVDHLVHFKIIEIIWHVKTNAVFFNFFQLFVKFFERTLHFINEKRDTFAFRWFIENLFEDRIIENLYLHIRLL